MTRDREKWTERMLTEKRQREWEIDETKIFCNNDSLTL